MAFNGSIDTFNVAMDAKKPIGDESGPTPKQLVLAAICGCSGMDVISLLKKFKQVATAFEIEAEASLTEGGHPVVFKEVRLKYMLKGEIAAEKIKEAVLLSQSKFCGVSAMIARVAPIYYEIYLNDEKLNEGKSQFI